MSFSVRILGTGAAIPTLKRNASSQLVICQQRHILIDCGEGTQIQMRKHKVKFQRIQLILISHLHGDHVLGLPGLIGTMQLLGRTKPLTIIGPKGIEALLDTFFKLAGLHVSFPIHFQALENKQSGIIYEDKCIEIKTFPLRHRIPTYGFRINEKPGKRHLNKEAFDKTGVSVSYIEKLTSGQDIVDNQGVVVKYKDVTDPPSPTKSYAYCSDTSYFPELVEHIKNVDLLYHEATFTEKLIDRAKETYHSTAKQAALIAQQAEAKRLILGHFSARYDNAEEHLKEASEVHSHVFTPEDGAYFLV